MFSIVTEDYLGGGNSNQAQSYQPVIEKRSNDGVFLHDNIRVAARDLIQEEAYALRGFGYGASSQDRDVVPSGTIGADAERRADEREPNPVHPSVDAPSPLPDRPDPQRPRDRDATSRGGGLRARPGIVPVHDVTGAVESRHLRAARALLGWAMSDLATMSGLSLSTIRRLEQSTRAVSPRNHQAAVDALRLGGIRFFTLDDGTTALAESPHRLAPLLQTGAPGDATPD